MSQSIRCVKNCLLSVEDQSGKEEDRKFVYGRWYSIQYVQAIPNRPDHVNVVLKNGDTVYGAHRKIFELGKTTILDADVDKGAQSEVEPDVPPADKLEKPVPTTLDRAVPREEDVFVCELGGEKDESHLPCGWENCDFVFGEDEEDD